MHDNMEAVLSQPDVMARISRVVSSQLTLDEMLGEVLGLTVQVTSCDACLVYLIDQATGEMVLRASQLPHAEELNSFRIRAHEGVAGWVADHNSPVAIAAKASSDPRFKAFSLLIEDTYEALLSVPLVSGGEVIGVVNIHHREPYTHSREEIELAAFVGEQMGNAIARSRLVDENLRLQDEIQTRKVVERAKGILQRNHNMTEEEAYLRLRGEARRMRKPMKELAQAIILSEEVNRKTAALV